MQEAAPPGNRLKSAHSVLVQMLEAPPPTTALAPPTERQPPVKRKMGGATEGEGPVEKRPKEAGGECECDGSDSDDSGCEGLVEEEPEVADDDVRFF